MKKLILTVLLNLALSLIFCNFASGQTIDSPGTDRDKPVVTTQGYIDDATKAFDLVVQYRDALVKALGERQMSLIERQNAETLIKGLNDLIAIKDKTIDSVEKLQAVYEKILNLQNQMLDRMQKMIEIEQASRKNQSSFLRDLWKGAKQVFAVLVTVVTVKKVAGIIGK